jgi:hypothetical protein
MLYFLFPWSPPGIIIATIITRTIVHNAGRFAKPSLHFQKGRPQVHPLSGFFIVCELGFGFR